MHDDGPEVQGARKAPGGLNHLKANAGTDMIKSTSPRPQMATWKWRIIATFVFAVSASCARGQHLNADSVPTDDQSTAIESVTLPIASTADSGFWFLSTHSSPQSFNHSCPQFCPGVSRYDQCAGFRPSNLSELATGLEPGVPVCIVVHGSFMDQPTACKESTCVWNWLKSASMGRRMQMIYFNWPSYSRITPFVAIDVNALGRRAARNGYYLAELLQYVPAECPVCLVGHSHGTRVVSSALHLLAGGSIQHVRHPYARANGRQIRTVFTAGAIDHTWLNPGKRYDRALCSTECLLNMHNRADPAMKAYPLRLPFISKCPIGLRGLTQWDRRRLGPWGNKVLDYDVSRLIGPRHVYPYFFRNNNVAMIMHNYVYFPDRVTAPPTLKVLDVTAAVERDEARSKLR